MAMAGRPILSEEHGVLWVVGTFGTVYSLKIERMWLIFRLRKERDRWTETRTAPGVFATESRT